MDLGKGLPKISIIQFDSPSQTSYQERINISFGQWAEKKSAQTFNAFSRHNGIRITNDYREKYDAVEVTDRIQIFEIAWKETPFSFETTLLWRGITIQINIKDERTQFGSKTTFEVTKDGVKYVYGIVKWKYSGGAFGKRPLIYSRTHSLFVWGSLKRLTLEEEFFKPLTEQKTLY